MPGEAPPKRAGQFPVYAKSPHIRTCRGGGSRLISPGVIRTGNYLHSVARMPSERDFDRKFGIVEVVSVGAQYPS